MTAERTTDALRAGDVMRTEDVLPEATVHHWRQARAVFLPMGWQVLVHPPDDFYVMLTLPGNSLKQTSAMTTPTVEPTDRGLSYQPPGEPGDNPASAVEFATAEALLQWLGE